MNPVQRIGWWLSPVAWRSTTDTFGCPRQFDSKSRHQIMEIVLMQWPQSISTLPFLAYFNSSLHYNRTSLNCSACSTVNFCISYPSGTLSTHSASPLPHPCCSSVRSKRASRLLPSAKLLLLILKPSLSQTNTFFFVLVTFLPIDFPGEMALSEILPLCLLRVIPLSSFSWKSSYLVSVFKYHFCRFDCPRISGHSREEHKIMSRNKAQRDNVYWHHCQGPNTHVDTDTCILHPPTVTWHN